MQGWHEAEITTKGLRGFEGHRGSSARSNPIVSNPRTISCGGMTCQRLARSFGAMLM